MAKKNEIDTYIKKSKKGDKDAYRKIIEFLYDEIYNLTAFIYDDDETKEKLTKHLFIKAYKNIAGYDADECDIHLWMAREATKELYKVVCDREDEIFSNEIEQIDYEYESIEDDDELGEASAEFNEAFLTDAGFDKEEGCFASLTIGEKIIYLLYCYEGYSVDEIETIMDIDSGFITSEIASMREGVLAAYAPIKAENADENEDALDNDEDVLDVSSGDDSDEDDFENYEDDDDIFYSEDRLKKASAGRDKKKYAIGSLRLTEKEFKTLIVGVIAAIVLIVVIVVVIVVSGHNKDNNNAVTTPAASTTTVTTTQAATEATQPSTTEEETTTTAAAKRPQSGTQPNVNISTTEAPTEAATQASTEAATKATQKATEATKSPEEIASSIQASIDALRNTTAATQASTAAPATTAATQASTAAPATTAAATQSGNGVAAQ